MINTKTNRIEINTDKDKDKEIDKETEREIEKNNDQNNEKVTKQKTDKIINPNPNNDNHHDIDNAQTIKTGKDNPKNHDHHVTYNPHHDTKPVAHEVPAEDKDKTESNLLLYLVASDSILHPKVTKAIWAKTLKKWKNSTEPKPNNN